MIENPLMNFLTKSAYTPWVNNDLPEITNSGSWEDFSYDPDALANHKYNAALNALKRSLSPEAWNKFVNDVNYRYRGQPNEYEVSNFLKSYSAHHPESASTLAPASTPVSNSTQYRDPNAFDPNAFDPQFDSDKTIGDALDQRSGSQTVTIPDLSTNVVHNPVPALAPKTVQSLDPNAFDPQFDSDQTIGDALDPRSGSETITIPDLGVQVAKPSSKPAAASPALPSSALTAAGGANVSFQTPTVNIPEFNPAPKPASAPAPAAQATQNPFYDPKSITRQQMQQYRRYTGATNMNSDMDRWKTYQAMNGNRNASNADYYSAKKNNSLGAVKNPITQPK